MHWIDWIIVIVPLFVVVLIALKSQKYVKGVADFLTAGRVAGRYVVAVASGEAATGLISLVAIFEMYYTCGFAVSFWSSIATPIGLAFALTGYCTYRFRETRAMTMGQFFEMRYSKSFRIFAAILQSASGVINYAIFPAVSARFLIYFLDLPTHIQFLGLDFPTFGLIMFAFLSLAVLIITLGGQITIMTTDCVAGILSYPMYVIIVGFILIKFSWSQEMAPTLLDRAPGMSLLNPYDVYLLRDFNLFYIFVGIFSSIFNRMSWSGLQGYNCSAANAHEQKMGGLLGTWRAGFSVMMYILLAVAAYTYLHHAHFAPKAKNIHVQLTKKTLSDIAAGNEFADARKEINSMLTTGQLNESLKNSLPENTKIKPESITPDDYKGISQAALAQVRKGTGQTFSTIYNQMLVPTAIREMLPIGLTGVFCALMIFLLVTTDTSYLHSWGSIIVQDLVLPFRKTPFTPKQQLMLLRLVIAGVAVFAFLFSFFFAQIDYILMFFAITGAIWLGGAGPIIVFGLYWKRGTTPGAFAALGSGAFLAVGGIIIQQTWVDHVYPALLRWELVEPLGRVLETVSSPFNPYIIWSMRADRFPINSQEIYFIAMVTAITLYVIISLITCRTPFNLERILHRGKYRVAGEAEKVKIPLTWKTFPSKVIGIDSAYTRGDKILAWSVFLWSFGKVFVLFFVCVVIWNVFYKWPDEWWVHYFFITNVLVAGIVGVVSTVWFSIGGTTDLLKMFRALDKRALDETNALDDGRVIGHISAVDAKRMEELDDTEPKK
jgi:Na+/proline symporter